LHTGSVVNAAHVTTEINNTFDNLMTVLTEVRPSKLNATLGAFAEALNGQGDTLGDTIDVANKYLTKLNPNLPALQRDFRSAAGFSNIYANAAPNLVNLISNLGVTTRTLSDPRVHLPELLHDIKGVGEEIDGFFDVNANGLTGMLTSLRPTTSLLLKYAPIVRCFINGEAHYYYQANQTLASANGAQFEIAPTAGIKPYSIKDLPKIGPGPLAPSCHGLPDPGPSELSMLDKTSDPQSLNDVHDNRYQVPTQPAVVSMFGPNAVPLNKPSAPAGIGRRNGR
jgi:phospholipid/cholesterol/gamma-HCH transport system substrate-binding protein